MSESCVHAYDIPDYPIDCRSFQQYFLTTILYVGIMILGSVWCKCADLWAKWLWEELPVPCSWWGKEICKTNGGMQSMVVIELFCQVLILFLLQLWPLFGGRLTKPVRGKLFYVPQVRPSTLFDNNVLFLCTLTMFRSIWHIFLVISETVHDSWNAQRSSYIPGYCGRSEKERDFWPGNDN